MRKEDMGTGAMELHGPVPVVPAAAGYPAPPAGGGGMAQSSIARTLVPRRPADAAAMGDILPRIPPRAHTRGVRRRRMKKFLIKHVGNMGDMIFFIPPVLATLKRRYPNCHITFVTAWGFKTKKRKWLTGRSSQREGWGLRNQGGFCIHLMMTNPHVDQLIHWHDTKLSLDGKICVEDGQQFPTWNAEYFEQQKRSGNYDAVFELDFGIGHKDNPLQKMYEAIGWPKENYTQYKLYLTRHDRAVAAEVMKEAPRPRIVLLEGIETATTRSWDPGKIPALEQAIEAVYGTRPIWFGSQHVPEYRGRPLTLRENVATLELGDAAIGVLSGPLHLAAAAGIPTITLYCDHPIHRAAPAYFLNQYIADPARRHRTLLGPSCQPFALLKRTSAEPCLTPAEQKRQLFTSWLTPGRQATKSCLAAITVDEVMTALQDLLPPQARKHIS